MNKFLNGIGKGCASFATFVFEFMTVSVILAVCLMMVTICIIAPLIIVLCALFEYGITALPLLIFTVIMVIGIWYEAYGDKS